MSEISALDNWAGSYTAVIIIIIIIIIRCFVLAQECPRIDGVRRLMAYSTSVYGHPVADIMPRAWAMMKYHIEANVHARAPKHTILDLK